MSDLLLSKGHESQGEKPCRDVKYYSIHCDY